MSRNNASLENNQDHVYLSPTQQQLRSPGHKRTATGEVKSYASTHVRSMSEDSAGNRIAEVFSPFSQKKTKDERTNRIR